MVGASVSLTRRWPVAVEAELQNHFDVMLNKGDKSLSELKLTACLRKSTANLQWKKGDS